jgi:hypothetical protein
VLTDLRSRFPGYKLETYAAGDPEWQFIAGYTATYFSGA